MVSNKVLTLGFIRDASRILLGFKKRGFGNGRWNGFGGKVEKGETIEAAAQRELLEESGLTTDSFDKIGILMFEFVGDPQLLEVHVFQTHKFTGSPKETEEMRPQWYDLDEIPYKNMWADDILWIPHMLNGSKFYGYFRFDGMSTIVKHTLSTVDTLSSITIPREPLTDF